MLKFLWLLVLLLLLVLGSPLHPVLGQSASWKMFTQPAGNIQSPQPSARSAQLTQLSGRPAPPIAVTRAKLPEQSPSKGATHYDSAGNNDTHHDSAHRYAKTAKPATRIVTTDMLHSYLSRKLIDIDYNETPFEDIVGDLRDRLGVNILVYWPALARTNILPSDPVTVKLQGVPAETAIAAVVRYLSLSGSHSTSLDYQIDRGVLEIGPADVLVRRQVLKVYYIADLLGPRSSYDNSLLDSASGRRSGRSNTSRTNFSDRVKGSTHSTGRTTPRRTGSNRSR